MFHTRSTLHRKAYKHKTVTIVEKMYVAKLVPLILNFPIKGDCSINIVYIYAYHCILGLLMLWKLLMNTFL